MSKATIGNKGEDLACEYLKEQGSQIIARNFRIRGGEIDIIGKNEGILVFVEVKFRSSNQYGSSLEAITSWKINFLQKAALFYIQKIGWGDRPYRFDAVGIEQDKDKTNIELIKNIT